MFESTHEIVLSSKNPYFDFQPNSGKYSYLMFYVPNLNLSYCKYAKLKTKKAEFPNIFANITLENNTLILDVIQNNILTGMIRIDFPVSFYSIFEIVNYVNDQSVQNNWNLTCAYDNANFKISFSIDSNDILLRINENTTIQKELGLIFDDEVANPLVGKEPVELLSYSNIYITTDTVLNRSYCTEAELLYFTQISIDVGPGEIITYIDNSNTSAIIPTGTDLRYLPISLLDSKKRLLDFQNTHWKIYLELTYFYDELPTYGNLKDTIEILNH